MKPESLIEFGLSINEAKVYVALLELKKAKIMAISSKARLHSKNAYEALNRLVDKGLVSFLLEKGAKVYKCESPMKFREILVTKSKGLDLLLPEMISKFRTEEPIREVTVMKGEEGLTNMITGLIEELGKMQKKDIVVYAPHDLSSLMEESRKIKFRKLFAGVKAANGTLRLIDIDSEKTRQNAKELDKGFEKFVKRRYFPGISNTSVAWSAVGNRCFINFFTPKDYLNIRIISESVATAMREEFEILWGLASN